MNRRKAIIAGGVTTTLLLIAELGGADLTGLAPAFNDVITGLVTLFGF